MTIVGFVHGLESGVGGRKARFLGEHVERLVLCTQLPYPLNVCLWVWTLAHTWWQLRRGRVECVVASSFGACIVWYLALLRLWDGPLLLLGLPTRVCCGRRFFPPHVACTFLFGKHDRLSTEAHRRALAQLPSKSNARRMVLQVDDQHALNQHLHLLPDLIASVCASTSQKENTREMSMLFFM
jgi:hypothetical protein